MENNEPNKLGDITRVGLLELKQKAFDSEILVLNSKIKSLNDSLDLIKRGASAKDTGEERKAERKHRFNLIKKMFIDEAQEEENAFTKTDWSERMIGDLGIMGFDMGLNFAEEKNPDLPEKGPDFLDPLTFGFNLIMPSDSKATDGDDLIPPEPRDPEIPYCSVDVLCKREDGSWFIGWYDYDSGSWGSADNFDKIIQWRWLPF